jgi:hypothetical protein
LWLIFWYCSPLCVLVDTSDYACLCKFEIIACGTHPLDMHSTNVLEDCEQGRSFLISAAFLNFSQVYSNKFDRSPVSPVLWQRHSFQFICFTLAFSFDFVYVHCRSFWAKLLRYRDKDNKVCNRNLLKIYKMYQQEKTLKNLKYNNKV